MVKNPPVMQETISGLGRSPRVENRNPLQYSCLENSKDRGVAGYSPWSRKESNTTESLTEHTVKLDSNSFALFEM